MSSLEFDPEEYTAQIERAAQVVKDLLLKYSELSQPRVLVICGSGLGGIADSLQAEPRVEVPYHDIPGFKTSTVPGHAGKLIFGLMGAKRVPVMCMVGRLHFYEGYSFHETTFPVRMAKVIGVSVLVVTNAAGGVNSSYKPGDLMIINDHINFPGMAGYHPLRGANLDNFGPRFQPLSDAYELELRKLFFQTKQKLAINRTVHEGTYFFVSGPTFESRAEVRGIRTLGGDAVGMSTVPEVIVARHSGLRVLALSLITNAGMGDEPASAFDANPRPLAEAMASHEEVLETASQASADVQKIIEHAINEL